MIATTQPTCQISAIAVELAPLEITQVAGGLGGDTPPSGPPKIMSFAQLFTTAQAPVITDVPNPPQR